MTKKDFIITAVIAVLSVALIVMVIVTKKQDAGNNPSTPSSVAHDHDGDGVPDHDDSYHATSGDEEDTDIDIGLDIEDQPTEGTGSTGSTGSTEGTGGGAVDGGEIDMDDLINAGGNN